MLCQKGQQFAAVGVEFRAAGLEKASVFGFQQLDPQPLRRNRNLNLVGKRLEVIQLVNALLQPLFELSNIVLRDGQVVRCAGTIRSGKSRAAQRIVEIARDRLAYMVAGIHQPQHDKQRH